MSTLLRTVLILPPAAPTCIAISPSQINISWAQVLNANSYRVYRNGVLVDSTSGITSSSAGLTQATLYSFQVSSVANDGQEGPKSAAGTATTLTQSDTIAPTIPGSVAAAAISTTTIRITWAASTDTGGSGLAGYRVYRSTTLAGTYTQVGSDLTVLTYDDTSLAASTTRYYKVLAFDGNANTSALSAAANATTLAGSTPGVIRFSPGHYKWIDTGSGGGGQTGELAQISALSGKTYMAGAKWSPDWADLEGAVRGDYTAGFAKADLYRNAAAAAGKKLMIDPKFQYFGSSPTSVNGKFPSYLGTIDAGSPGYTLWPGPPAAPLNGNLVLVAHLWKQVVMDAYIQLGQAYANRYKDDPVVEMWSTGETAIDPPSGSGYSSIAWVTQLKRWMTAMRAAWPNTGIRVQTNYLGSDAQMQDIIAYALTERIACGGPDNYSRIYQSNPIFTGFNGGIDYRNRIPWVSESQYPASSSGGRTDLGDPDPSSAQIYAHNVSGSLAAGGGTNPNYFVWFNNTYTGATPGLYHTYPAETEPFIASISGAANATNPYDSQFDFYIGPSGSNSNPGTPTSPWAITALASKPEVAGKRIGLLDGTYNLSAMTPLSGGDNNLINVQVTSTADTTVAAVHPRLAIIDGHSGASYPHNNSGLIGTTSNTGRLIVDGLKIIGWGSSGMVLGNSANHGSATTFTPNITIRNCEFTGGDIRGAPAGGNHAAMKCYQLQNCLFENNWHHDNIARDGAGSTDHLSDILFFHQKDCIIRQCSLERSGGVFGKWSRSVNITVDRCYFDFTGYNSEARLIFDFNTADEGANGFIRILNNVIIGPQCADLRPTSNQLAGGTTNLEFINNTVVHSAHGLIGTVPAGTAKVYNNIFSSSASGDQSFITINVDANGLIDFNDYHNTVDPKWGSYTGNLASTGRTTYGSISAWKSAMGSNSQTGLGCDENSLTSNPMFTATGSKAARYQIQSGSLALTAGRVNGFTAATACQMGAWGGATPPTRIGCDFS